MKKILGIPFGKKEPVITWNDQVEAAVTSFKNDKPVAYGYRKPIIRIPDFDGEKSPGELGTPVEYDTDYYGLAARCWDMYTKSSLAKIIINTYVDWVIGKGLELQADPIESIINDAGYNFDKKKFEVLIQQLYMLYTKTNHSVHSKNLPLKKMERQSERQAIVGGDCLHVFRYGKHGTTIQVVDGRDIRTPLEEVIEAEKRGNKIIHGVEVDPSGTHVAFYVVDKSGEYKRIEAYGKRTKRLQAVMRYGTEHRVDDVRGMGIIAVMIEEINKADRYIEAAVGTMEEQANIPFVFQHDVNGSGKNPQFKELIDSTGEFKSTENPNAGDIETATNTVVRTTNKEPINLPPGCEAKTLDKKMEAYNPEFVDGIFTYMTASASIPIEVALMRFTNSFSASRMATKSFEHILEVRRMEAVRTLNQPFYNLQLERYVLDNKVQADGYIQSLRRQDVELSEAYRNAHWDGPSVPYANPQQEIQASILAIDNQLSNREKETRKLNNGDFRNNVTELEKENELIKEKGLIPEPEPAGGTQPTNQE